MATFAHNEKSIIGGNTKIMNWIILVIAGLCEVGFTFCLGKAKAATGLLYWEWMGGFLAIVLPHPPDCLHHRTENVVRGDCPLVNECKNYPLGV